MVEELKQQENNQEEQSPNLQKVDVVQGNVPVLTVNLLNLINNNLIRIANLLEEKKDG